MHELSLCGAIADIVSRRAGDRGVETVHVRIGQLRQVVPSTLAFCWTMVTADSPLDGSALDVERVAATVHCRSCGEQRPVGDMIALACTACGALDVDVVAGDEFLVTALDLARA